MPASCAARQAAFHTHQSLKAWEGGGYALQGSAHVAQRHAIQCTFLRREQGQ